VAMVRSFAMLRKKKSFKDGSILFRRTRRRRKTVKHRREALEVKEIKRSEFDLGHLGR